MDEAKQKMYDVVARFKELEAQDRRQAQQTLDELSGRVFEVYRLALRNDFKSENVFKCANWGVEVPHYESLTADQKSLMYAYGIKHPTKTATDEIVGQIVPQLAAHLSKRGQVIDQVNLNELTTSLLSLADHLHDQSGDQFRIAAWMPGLRGLNAELNYQIHNKNHYSGTPEADKMITEMAIKAHYQVIAQAMIAADNVLLHKPLTLDPVKINGIKNCEVKEDKATRKLVIAYTCRDGKTGEVDPLTQTLSFDNLFNGTEFTTNLMDNFHRTEKNPDDIYKVLIRDADEIVAIAGATPIYRGTENPNQVAVEMKANYQREMLGRFGVDLTQAPVAVLADLGERVQFFYPIKERTKDHLADYVVFEYDEREHQTYLKAETQEDFDHTRKIDESGARLDSSGKQYVFEPISVKQYFDMRAEGKRLTNSHL